MDSENVRRLNVDLKMVQEVPSGWPREQAEPWAPFLESISKPSAGAAEQLWVPVDLSAKVKLSGGHGSSWLIA